MLETNSTEDETEELKSQAERLRAKLQSKKLELGRILRTVSARERLFDQIPSRAELSQYQKRFVELHNQSKELSLIRCCKGLRFAFKCCVMKIFAVALKHTETKRYFILFNTLNDKFHYMGKEYNILNSIHDSYFQ
jgi:predicted nuclease with TOPRIM domain